MWPICAYTMIFFWNWGVKSGVISQAIPHNDILINANDLSRIKQVAYSPAGKERLQFLRVALIVMAQFERAFLSAWLPPFSWPSKYIRPLKAELKAALVLMFHPSGTWLRRVYFWCHETRCWIFSLSFPRELQILVLLELVLEA